MNFLSKPISDRVLPAKQVLDRRLFITGTILGLAASPLRAKDPCLNTLKHSTLDVGTKNGGRLEHIYRVSGWEVNCEEDDKVLFDFVITNPGPKQVRVVRCQPYTFGPWEIIERFPVGVVSGQPVKQRWRANNDSNFIYVEIDNGGNSWASLNSDNPNSTGNLTASNTVAHLEWHSPQEVRFELRATDTRR